jgi:L-aspartate oxidase
LFHPKAKSFSISEAVRGEGAVLKTAEGAEFMDSYHPLKSLHRAMCRRAIDSEMKKSGADCVFLDITHQPKEFLRERFPNIYETCLRYGIDMAREPIPVVPAAHYQCGGVVTNWTAKQRSPDFVRLGSRLHRLHGANRWRVIRFWKRWSARIEPPKS